MKEEADRYNKIKTKEEIDFEEFDIVVKFQFATKHKILAKINNISNGMDKLIINNGYNA